jgi:DNA invertase Pin-like site-specific DNA recombinase
LAKTQNYEVVAEIAEKVSGSKDNKDRDGVQELLRLAQKGIIQKVLVQEVSRLGRSKVDRYLH